MAFDIKLTRIFLKSILSIRVGYSPEWLSEICCFFLQSVCVCVRGAKACGLRPGKSLSRAATARRALVPPAPAQRPVRKRVHLGGPRRAARRTQCCLCAPRRPAVLLPLVHENGPSPDQRPGAARCSGCCGPCAALRAPSPARARRRRPPPALCAVCCGALCPMLRYSFGVVACLNHVSLLKVDGSAAPRCLLRQSAGSCGFHRPRAAKHVGVVVRGLCGVRPGRACVSVCVSLRPRTPHAPAASRCCPSDYERFNRNSFSIHRDTWDPFRTITTFRLPGWHRLWLSFQSHSPISLCHPCCTAVTAERSHYPDHATPAGYLALEDSYLPLRAAVPSNPTLVGSSLLERTLHGAFTLPGVRFDILKRTLVFRRT
jgi:hypothetical protein